MLIVLLIAKVLLAALALLAAFVMALSSLFMFGHAAGSYLISRESKTWPVVPGEITRSEVRPNTLANGLPGNRYKVGYTYIVKSRGHEGNMVCAAVFPYGTKRWASRRIAPYPVGAAANVHYDPADPETSVLETGFGIEFLYSILMVALPVGLAASLASAGLWLAWQVYSSIIV